MGRKKISETLASLIIADTYCSEHIPKSSSDIIHLKFWIYYRWSSIFCMTHPIFSLILYTWISEPRRPHVSLLNIICRISFCFKNLSCCSLLYINVTRRLCFESIKKYKRGKLIIKDRDCNKSALSQYLWKAVFLSFVDESQVYWYILISTGLFNV